MNTLDQLIKGFQEAEGGIDVGLDPKVTAFEVDAKNRRIFLGFKNGKVSFWIFHFVYQKSKNERF